MIETTKVVVLGASDQPHRYSNMAQRSLMKRGYDVIPVHPLLKEIEGVPVVKQLADISGDIHTVTLYVGSSRVAELANDIVALKPQRIISNPGTECAELRNLARSKGIEYIEACTLVMLSTDQF